MFGVYEGVLEPY